MILGKEIVVDARTELRVKWAQRGIGTFSFFGVLCYMVGYATGLMRLAGLLNHCHHSMVAYIC